MAGLLADTTFEDASIEPLFNDTVKKLEADAVSREIDALNARERENGLNPAERRQLAELLLHKQKLRTRPKASDS
jgi:DNA primase